MSSDSGSSSPVDDLPLLSGRRRRSSTFGKIVEDMSVTDFNGLEVYNWEDDDLSLRYAAANSRLPFDRFSADELNYFADVAIDKSSRNLYLLLRNKCLQLWHSGPQVQLTFEAFRDQIKKPLNSDQDLMRRVHDFLERYCYINYGLFHVTTHKKLNLPKKVIVIGAGYSGLMAALQLRFFGFEVMVLEARPRTGGRVMTYAPTPERRIKGHADLGAMVVMGVVGNPIMTLVQQCPIRLVQLNNNCAIYDKNGEKVPADKDEHIQKAFNVLLDSCTYISKELKVNQLNGKALSLGQAIDLMCNQMELRVQKRRQTFWTNLGRLAERQKQLIDECYLLGNEVKRLSEQLERAIKNKEEYLFDIDISKVEDTDQLSRLLELRCYRRDLKIALERFKTKSAEIETQRSHYKEMMRVEPCQVYMNTHDKNIVNFHKANLEYANGAPLHKVALEYWTVDDEWDFDGAHFMVKGGYSKITNSISDCLRDIIKKSHVVTNIDHSGDHGLKVRGYVEDKTQAPFLEEADAVICTLPLGVLKWSRSASSASDKSKLTFNPPLPKWKTRAIDNMGFGSLNKAILFFEKPFWDQAEDIFGKLSETETARGECFQFFAVPNEAVLIALISGTAANYPDGVNYDQLLQNRLMNFLRSAFPGCPSAPIEFLVTRWHTDRFARGCYSYISPDATDKDHETLAEPVCDGNGHPRLFFAGEHTICRWPSTVHGAMLSGLREATRIADAFLGPLPSPCTEQQKELAKQQMTKVSPELDEDVKLGDFTDEFESSDDDSVVF